MKKVAVLSDTHGLLRPEVMERIYDCDVIIHGGDINKQEIITELEKIAPVYVVRGNNDKEWAEHLPNSLEFMIEDVRIFLVHNKKDIPKNLENVDMIIFGHSHKYLEKVEGNVFYLNPGSCGKRRFDQEISFAVMYVNNKDVKVEKVTIEHK